MSNPQPIKGGEAHDRILRRQQMTAPVTIVTCVYGNRRYARFVQRWSRAITKLTTQPEAVIISTDQPIPADHGFADILHTENQWRHPQAYHLQNAISAARSDWVWILDIDDTALPDALDGIAHVEADVWQMGYQRSDGEVHIPPQLTASEYLVAEGNPFTGASAIYREAFKDCGGFPDVAFQDFGLWRRLALIGGTFLSSGRAHYKYNLHPDTRTELELVPDRRAEFMAEMVDSEEGIRA